MVGDFVYFRRISNRKAYFSELVKSPCCASHFDLLRKPPSTVPMYADEFGLLVLAAPLTSASLSKNKFFARLKNGSSEPFFCAEQPPLWGNTAAVGRLVAIGENVRLIIL